MQNACAQPAAIDSLKNELAQHSQADTTKVKLLIQLSNAYYNISSDSQILYASEASSIANNLNYKKLQSNAHMQVGNAYFSMNNLDSALAHYTTSLEICHAYGYEDLLASRYNVLGNISIRHTNYGNALLYYDSAIAIAEKTDQLGDLARARSNVATVYYEQGSYSAALKNFMETLDLHERLGNKKDVESSLLNITNVYFRLGDYNKATEYADKAMQMVKQSGSRYNIISCYTTFAMIYNEQKLYDSSLLYLSKAYEDALELKNKFVTNLLKGNMAECYMNKGMLDTAYKLYYESMITSEQLGDLEGVAVCKGGLGEILVKRGHYYKGIQYLKDALAILRKKNMKEEAMVLTGLLSETYEQLGDHKKALQYFHLKSDYKDSIGKDDALKTARSLEFDYILDKKEAQINLLEKDKAIEVSKLKQQRLLLIAALIGLALVIIIAVLIFRNLRQERLNKMLLLEQKKEIEIQAEKLQQLNTFKDTTFSVLSHDLRSPINALTGTMAMLEEGIITPEEFTEHKNELNNKLQSVTLMLDNLLQWAKSQMKGVHTLNPEKISIQRKTLKAFAVLKDAAKQKNIQLISNVPENLYAHADKNQAEMVMRNLVSNAIKFTPDNGKVTVDAEQNGNMIAVRVTDTGIGMSKEQADQLFDGTPNESAQGTNGEKGTGIGLQLSYNFVRNNGGSLVVQSTKGKGTSFLLSLPAEA